MQFLPGNGSRRPAGALSFFNSPILRRVGRPLPKFRCAVAVVPVGMAVLFASIIFATTATSARADAVAIDLAAACLSRYEQPREAARCIDLVDQHVVRFSRFLVSAGRDNESAYARSLANAATRMSDYREFSMLMNVAIDTIDSVSRMTAVVEALGIWNDLCPSKFRSLELANCSIVTVSGLRRIKPMLEAAM